MILPRYIARNIAAAGAIALALLLTLFSFLGLTEALEDVGRGAFTTSDAISVVLLSVPARIVDLLPVTTLLGSIVGLGIMANRNEITAVRAAGYSPWRMARGLAGIAAFIIVGAIVLQFLVIPFAEQRAQAFRSRTLDQTALGPAAFWSRHGGHIIRIGEVRFGRIPQFIEIYELDDQSRIARLLTARYADIVDDDTWTLHGVEERVIDGEQVLRRSLGHMLWRSFLSPDQVATLIAPPQALSPLELHRFLAESEGSGVDTVAHQARFWRQVSLPLTLLGMTVLGLPLVAGSVRQRSGGFRAVLGGSIGIVFYLFERITGELAVILDISPAMTAFLPAIAVSLAAFMGVRRLS